MIFRFSRLLVILVLSFSLTSCSSLQKNQKSVAGSPEQIAALAFDVDDNILFLSTPIVLFKQEKDGSVKTLDVSTGRFAADKEKISKEYGRYRGYKIMKTPEHNSFMYFRDGSENYLIRDFLKSVAEAKKKGKPLAWQGPVFAQFREALSAPQTARWTYIITARGHSRPTFKQFFEYLKDFKYRDQKGEVQSGIVKYLPPSENVFAVSSPDSGGDAAKPALVKAEKEMEILDSIEAVPLPTTAVEVLNSEGTKKDRLHTWGFSDDDYENYEGALTVLSKNMVRSDGSPRWPHVKVALYYTGPHRKDAPRSGIVLKPDGTSREIMKAESGVMFRGAREE